MPPCSPTPTYLPLPFRTAQDGQRTSKSKAADKTEAKRLKIGKVEAKYTASSAPADVLERLNDRQKKFLDIAYASLKDTQMMSNLFLKPPGSTSCGLTTYTKPQL